MERLMDLISSLFSPLVEALRKLVHVQEEAHIVFIRWASKDSFEKPYRWGCSTPKNQYFKIRPKTLYRARTSSKKYIQPYQRRNY